MKRIVVQLLLTGAFVPLLSGEDPPANLTSVSGVAIRQSTGKPLKRVALTLRANRGEDSYRALSGPDGSFVFAGVTPGEYRMASDLLTVKRLLGKTGPLDLRHVTIPAGTGLSGLVAQMSAPGLVRGKVMYEDGEPAWALVNLFSADGKLENAVEQGATNSRGEYEIAVSRPGGYYVVAVPADVRYVALMPLPGQSAGQAPMGYAHAFYPGVSSIRSASLVTVAEDSETGGIDIPLRPVPLVTLHGVVLNSETGQRLAGSLSIAAVGVTGFFKDPEELTASAGPDGAFVFRGVPAGAYYLRGGGQGWSVAQPIEAGMAPDQQVKVYYDPPRTIEGRVVMEAADGKPAPKSIEIAGSWVSLAPDGTFLASAAPGPHHAALLATDEPDLYVRSATLDGRLVSRGDFSVPPGGNPVRLDLVLGAGAGHLTIEVTDAGDDPQVAVLPASGAPLRGSEEILAGDNATFLVRRMPPGLATVLAWSGAEPCDFTAPDSCRGKGLSIVVEPGATLTVRVPVIR